jgi:hypothetical protein
MGKKVLEFFIFFMREVIKGALPRTGFRKTSDFCQKQQARRLA